MVPHVTVTGGVPSSTTATSNPTRVTISAQGRVGPQGEGTVLSASTLAGLKALALDPGAVYTLTDTDIRGDFLYQTAAAPYTANDYDVIKLNAVDLSVGALVRKPRATIENSHAAMYDLRFAGGIVRIPTDSPITPEYIDDSNHHPINMDTVEILQSPDPNAKALALTFARAGYVNGTHLATVDETYAHAGVVVGIRGTNAGPIIKGYRPLDFSVNMQSLALTIHPYFPGELSASASGDGAVTVTHPSVGYAPTPAIVEPFNSGYDLRVTSATATQITLRNFVPLGGRFTAASSTTMAFAGPLLYAPTASFNDGTGILTVTLNQTGFTLPDGYQRPLLINSYLPSVFIGPPTMAGTGGGTSFSVPILDSAGLPVTDLTGFSFDFSFPNWSVPSTVQAGVARIRRGLAEFDWTNAPNDTANIWIASIIPDSRGYAP